MKLVSIRIGKPRHDSMEMDVWFPLRSKQFERTDSTVKTKQQIVHR